MIVDKYVVMYEDSNCCLGIFDTEADAEEYILSWAEEGLYENFLFDTAATIWCTIEEWFDTWKLEDLMPFWTGEIFIPRQTSYSMMLNDFSESLIIRKCPYIGG